MESSSSCPLDSSDDSENMEISTKSTISQKPKRNVPPPLEFAIFIGFSSIPTILFILLRKIIGQDISRGYLPLIAFPLNFLLLYLVLFKKLRIPIERKQFSTYLHDIGLNRPHSIGLHLLLGLLLALLSTSGMMLGSYLTGKHSFDWSRLTWEQAIFALMPGFWEELFFRGLLMLFLLRYMKSVPKAIIVQSLVFALVHFYGFGLWDLIDLLSIFFLGLSFSYVALKTNSLWPGIIFHIVHDALNFLVQVPEGTTLSNVEHLFFFLGLWAMVLVGIGLVTIITQSKPYQEKKFDDILYQPLEKYGE